VSDQKLYFSVDNTQDNVELFRVRLDGTVEQVENSHSTPETVLIAENAPSGLADLALGPGAVVDAAGSETSPLLADDQAWLIDYGAQVGDEVVDVFVRTDLSPSELIANHELIAGDDIELDGLLDLAALGESGDDAAEFGRFEADETPAESDDIAEFEIGGSLDHLIIVVDDGSDEPPVTI
jgi:hypothetical protein